MPVPDFTGFAHGRGQAAVALLLGSCDAQFLLLRHTDMCDGFRNHEPADLGL